MSELVMVLTTWPDAEVARQQAENWLNKNLVACVNILPPMQSIYKWNDSIESGTEHQMLIKTSAGKIKALEQAIVDVHPYECPEILYLSLTGGYVEYVNWIMGNTE